MKLLKELRRKSQLTIIYNGSLLRVSLVWEKVKKEFLVSLLSSLLSYFSSYWIKFIIII